MFSKIGAFKIHSKTDLLVYQLLPEKRQRNDINFLPIFYTVRRNFYVL